MPAKKKTAAKADSSPKKSGVAGKTAKKTAVKKPAKKMTAKTKKRAVCMETNAETLSHLEPTCKGDHCKKCKGLPVHPHGLVGVLVAIIVVMSVAMFNAVSLIGTQASIIRFFR